MDIIKQKISIIIQPDSIERSGDGSITGIIYFDFSDFEFPESGWNDFIVVILGWWLETINRFMHGLNNVEKLQFMDGPFQVRLRNKDHIFCLVECVDEGRGGEVKYSKIISKKELRKSLLHAANDVTDFCRTKNFTSDDISFLNKMVKT